MNELLAAASAERRFTLVLFAVFAVTALALAAAGIYGVISSTVVDRTREIGVRSALGASAGTILSMVLGEGLVLTGLGIAVGLAARWGATVDMTAMLFSVSAFDPITYLTVVGLLVMVSLLACGVPGWRAVRMDPVHTLRSE